MYFALVASALPHSDEAFKQCKTLFLTGNTKIFASLPFPFRGLIVETRNWLKRQARFFHFPPSLPSSQSPQKL